MGRAGWQPACSSLLVPVWRYAGRHAGIYKLCRGRDFQSIQSLCQAFQPLEHPRDTRCVPRLCLWCLPWRCGGGCWSCSRDADRLVASRCWCRWMTNGADMLLCSKAARQDLHLSTCPWAMQWYAMYSELMYCIKIILIYTLISASKYARSNIVQRHKILSTAAFLNQHQQLLEKPFWPNWHRGFLVYQPVLQEGAP